MTFVFKPSAPTLPPTIGAYFETVLGAALEAKPDPTKPYSPYHPEFHVGTGCGAPCKVAIDAAAALLAALPDCAGPLRFAVVNAVRHQVEIHVYG